MSEATERAPGGTVLVIDDDDSFRFAMKKALRRLGYDVDEAPGGEPALGRLNAADPPDAALLDLRMGDLDGLDVLRRSSGTTTRVVVLTGHGTVAAAVEAMAVLRLLASAREAAAAADVPISICGDLAADPVATPVLLGLGFERLSMPMAAIPLVREVVSRIDVEACRELAAEALTQDGADDVERLVSARFGSALAELWREQGLHLPRS